METMHPKPDFIPAVETFKQTRAIVGSAECAAAEIKELRKQLEQTQQEFADYKTEQERQRTQKQLEQAKVYKKDRRRSWAQVVLSLVAAPAIALFIEHFQAVTDWIARFFRQ